MRDFLHHLFLPRESNNHRAKLLHHTSLLAVIALLFFLEFSFSLLHAHHNDILGDRTEITAEELLTLTNIKRKENGLPPLSMNQELVNAASQKAENMFSKNYWAHNGPDGTTPWVFVKSAGYDYLYAGENLARGFTSSSEVVDAWMASPGHRENMLSPNYKDIGFAIVPGKLTGDDTVLVVEMFGQQREDVAETSPEPGSAQAKSPIVVPQQAQQGAGSNDAKNPSVASVQTQPFLDMKKTTKSISLLILFVFLFTLLLDILVLSRKKIVRVVAHNIDTLMFISVIIVVIILIGNGIII